MTEIKSPPTAKQVEARVRAAIMKVKRDNPGSMRDPSANELTAAVLAALAPAERASPCAEDDEADDTVVPEAMLERGRQRAAKAVDDAAERASPVKHLSATGEFYERVRAWWLARGTSEFRGAAVTGDGYVNIWWEDASETGTYSVRIDDLYHAPTRAEAVADQEAYRAGRNAGINEAVSRLALWERGVVGEEITYAEHAIKIVSDLRTAAPTRAGALDAAGAMADIAAERRRQVEAEGWTPEHDDSHDRAEMAKAAICYATPYRAMGWYRGGLVPKIWPWGDEWWKPTDRRRDLVKAGALIVAEIERLDRAALAAGDGGKPAPADEPIGRAKLALDEARANGLDDDMDDLQSMMDRDRE